MSRDAIKDICKGIGTIIIAIILYLTGIISVWGLIAFLFVAVIVFGGSYVYWTRQQNGND